jgi:hypothetical protein
LSRRREHTDLIVLVPHLPKTGGTTLNNFIYREFARRFTHESAWAGELNQGRFELSAGVLYFRENNSAGFFREHYVSSLSAEDVAVLQQPDVHVVLGHFTFGLHEYLNRPVTYVTFVRDPVERVVSLYFHLLAYPDHYPLNSYVASRRVGIADFVMNLERREVDNDQVRRISGIDAPFGGCTPEMLEQAKENLTTRFSVVGLTERFAESLVLLKLRFGWEEEVFVRWLVNPSNPGQRALSEADLEAIVFHNRLDIELHAYAQALFEEAIAKEEPVFKSQLALLRERQRPSLGI